MKAVQLFVVIAGLFFTPSLFANSGAGFVGLNTTEFDSTGLGWDREFGIEFGGSYTHTINDKLAFRTGAGIVQKGSDPDGGRDVEFLLLEIPATLMFTVGNGVSLFGGLNLNLMLDDDDVNGSNFITVNLPVGARFQIEGPHAVEAYLEIGLTDYASAGGADLKLGNTLGGRYLYTFNSNL